MSTRSRIGIYENGEVKSIYCHWDGYIEHNGCILYNHYRTPEKIKELIALGDISILGRTIGKKTNFTTPAPDQCVAYHRDRGEDLIIRTTPLSEYPQLFEEYNYLFKDGKWYVAFYANDDEFEPLEDYV